MRYLIWVVVLFFLTGCKNEVREDKKQPLIVVATSLLADAVRNIVGDSVAVESLMGPGVDPHLYKASLGDLNKLMVADLVLYQGLYLEGKLGEVLEKLGRTKQVAALANQLPDRLIKKVDDQGEIPDPHIWFDVAVWKEVVIHANDVLAKQFPASSVYFKTNTDIYLSKLDSLDRYIRTEISTIPVEKRVLITSHDAFNYFGDAYDIEVRGLQGISTLSEFGLRDVSDLVKMISQRAIKAVFVETSVSPRSLNAVVAGVRDQGREVVIGGTLFTDALGEPDSEQGTYIGMMKYNADVIVKGLR